MSISPITGNMVNNSWDLDIPWNGTVQRTNTGTGILSTPYNMPGHYHGYGGSVSVPTPANAVMQDDMKSKLNKNKKELLLKMFNAKLNGEISTDDIENISINLIPHIRLMTDKNGKPILGFDNHETTDADALKSYPYDEYFFLMDDDTMPEVLEKYAEVINQMHQQLQEIRHKYFTKTSIKL